MYRSVDTSVDKPTDHQLDHLTLRADGTYDLVQGGSTKAKSTIPLSVGTFGIFQTLSVNVASMNSQSMTFTTNPGHLLYPASITFSASPAAQGSINFNINLGGTIANPFEFYLGGGNFEDAQWNHFLGQVGSYCKQQ